MSPQGCVPFVHPYHGCLSLSALSPEQSDPTTSIQKGLINWHPAYHPACHASKERLAELLSTFTIRSTMSSLTLHLHSPSSLPKCCWILPAPRGFQNPYLWIPNSPCLLRNLKDETKAGLLECATLGRLSKRKKRGAATQGQDSRAESSLTIADAMKEKNAVL